MIPDKLVNVRRWGQCSKCHKFRELRCGWNDMLTEIISLCDHCFNCPMDEEAFDMIFEKAGVPGPVRSNITHKAHMENARKHHASHTFNLEKIFPEDD
jgi:hypothetical protein